MQLPTLAPADWSIMVCDLAVAQALLEHESTRPLRTASVGKLFLLIEIARQAGTGELDLTELVSWTDDEWVEDSGLWYLMDQRALSVHDLCVLVGGFSDNLATNALIRRIGLPAITATTRALGCTGSALLDRIRTERGPDVPPTLSVGTAADLCDLMGRLLRGAVIDVDVSRLVRHWIAANADLSMVAAAFDLDPLAHAEPDRGITLINKTGTILTARIDVGTVTGPRGEVAYAVLANWADGPGTPDLRDQVLADMRAIGAQLRTYVGG